MGSFDTIRHLPRAYRRLSRFRHIVRVLFKYGFDTISLRERVPQTLKRLFMPWRKDETTEIAAQYSMPERLRMAFVELVPQVIAGMFSGCCHAPRHVGLSRCPP